LILGRISTGISWKRYVHIVHKTTDNLPLKYLYLIIDKDLKVCAVPVELNQVIQNWCVLNFFLSLPLLLFTLHPEGMNCEMVAYISP
jgi:hypothetical protein